MRVRSRSPHEIKTFVETLPKGAGGTPPPIVYDSFTVTNWKVSTPTVQGDFVTPLPYAVSDIKYQDSTIETLQLPTYWRYGYHSTRPSGFKLSSPLDGVVLSHSESTAPKCNVPGLDGLVATKVLNKMKNAAETSYGIEIAESKETATFLVDTFSDILGYIRAVRKGDFSKFFKENRPGTYAAHIKRFGKKAPDTAAARWLEWKYAVTPLLISADTISNDYVNGLAPEPPLIAFTDWYSKDLSSLDDLGNLSGKASAEMKIAVQVSNIDTRGLSRLGLGWADAPLVAWELIPFSFVADWAYPIGDWLRALSAMQGVNFHSGYITHKVKGSYSYETPVEDETVAYSKYSNKASFFALERRVLTNWPIPAIEVRNPFAKTDNIITAAALLWQAAKR